MMTRALLLRLLKAGVSLGLLGVIVFTVDLGAVWRRLDGDVALAGLAALVLLQVQALGAAARWRLVLSALDRALAFPVAWRNVLLGLFGNQAMPSTIGGDALRIWNGWRLGLPVGLATRSLIVDRVFSFLGLIVLCGAGLPVLAGRADDPLVVSGLLTLVLGGLGCLLVLLGLRWLPPGLAERSVARPLVSLSESAWRALGSRRVTPVILALMLVPHLIDITVVWLYALALGLDAPWWTIALVFPPAILTAAVPVSVAGWGLREGALVLGFGIVSLPADAALACSVLYGASAVVTGLIGGAVWAAGDADGFAALRRSGARIPSARTNGRPPDAPGDETNSGT
jgi:uncharacterized membrane protein YbhN (UPF0104 family)